MKVVDILRQKGREVLSLPVESNLSDAALLMAARRIGAVLITANGGTIAGILSERDVVRALASENVRALVQPASAYMTRAVATCREDDSVEALMEMMTQGRFRHIPVVDEAGKPCGLVSIGDIVKAHVEITSREASNLRAFIADAG
jgi:CBS domain-containing protein